MSTSCCLATARGNAQGADTNLIIAVQFPAPCKGFAAQGQLAEIEGLAKVIVCAGVEALRFVRKGITGSEHKNRGDSGGLLADPATHLEAVDIRQVQVQQNQVVDFCQGQLQPKLPTVGEVHMPAVPGQEFAGLTGERGIVFYQKNFEPVHRQVPVHLSE